MAPPATCSGCASRCPRTRSRSQRPHAPSAWKDATQTAELTASDGDSKDGLGAAVAISGGTIVAGPDRHDVDARINEGEAYVFVKPAGGWANGTESQILDGADGGAGDLF